MAEGAKSAGPWREGRRSGCGLRGSEGSEANFNYFVE